MLRFTSSLALPWLWPRLPCISLRVPLGRTTADPVRAEEKAQWETNSAEMEKGLNGVKLALKVFNEYYAKTDKAHSSSDEETELMAIIKSFKEMDTSNTSLEELLSMRNAESEASKQTLKDDDIDAVMPQACRPAAEIKKNVNFKSMGMLNLDVEEEGRRFSQEEHQSVHHEALRLCSACVESCTIDR